MKVTSYENGSVIMTQDQSTYQIITKVVTDGKSTCSAIRDYKLKSGEVEFVDFKDRNHYSGKQVDSLDCLISKED